MDSTGTLGHESTLASPALVSECCQGLAAPSSPRELNISATALPMQWMVLFVEIGAEKWIQDVMERSNDLQ